MKSAPFNTLKNRKREYKNEKTKTKFVAVILPPTHHMIAQARVDENTASNLIVSMKEFVRTK